LRAELRALASAKQLRKPTLSLDLNTVRSGAVIPDDQPGDFPLAIFCSLLHKA
jgi:hypothetical protein